jgi:hypothetical protein
MLWLLIGALGFGLLLGLFFRVAAVIAASVVLAAASLTMGPLLAEWSIWSVLSAVFGGAFALQCGYVTGLLLIFAWSRMDWSDTRERLLDSYRAMLARASRALIR